MTSGRKTKSFKTAKAISSDSHAQPEAPARQSFWQRLFGPRQPVDGARAKRQPAEVARAKTGQLAGVGGGPRPERSPTAPIATLPEDRPRNPKSFVAKKFNSQVVKAALLDAIGEAMGKPPPGIDPIESKFWIEGLAIKGMLVERLDCPRLKPDEHLRAIQWMARIEKLNPLKSTYREDLFALRFALDLLLAGKDAETPEAIGQGGVALRRLYQVVRTKLEGLGRLSDEQAGAAQAEIAAYERIMACIERAPVAHLDARDGLRLANVFRRIDPYKIEFTTRHARFEDNIVDILAEMEEVYASVGTLEEPGG
ncbi:MAG: hypothetical protein FJZ01_09745 [Candidatus Sericytochromatia bacterium]|nr:hypothetical protein [Candidatus Tanganyikabacteria bacterium]